MDPPRDLVKDAGLLVGLYLRQAQHKNLVVCTEADLSEEQQRELYGILEAKWKIFSKSQVDDIVAGCDLRTMTPNLLAMYDKKLDTMSGGGRRGGVSNLFSLPPTVYSADAAGATMSSPSRGDGVVVDPSTPLSGTFPMANDRLRGDGGIPLVSSASLAKLEAPQHPRVPRGGGSPSRPRRPLSPRVI
jgi:hypothetical protein